jgi:hypothetical protein
MRSGNYTIGLLTTLGNATLKTSKGDAQGSKSPKDRSSFMGIGQDHGEIGILKEGEYHINLT